MTETDEWIRTMAKATDMELRKLFDHYGIDKNEQEELKRIRVELDGPNKQVFVDDELAMSITITFGSFDTEEFHFSARVNYIHHYETTGG